MISRCAIARWNHSIIIKGIGRTIKIKKPRIGETQILTNRIKRSVRRRGRDEGYGKDDLIMFISNFNIFKITSLF